MKPILFLLLTLFYSNLNAQHLYAFKLQNCKTSTFCLDCGDIKAGYNEGHFQQLLVKLNNKLKLDGIEGAIMYQVLINADGKACVLSHTDESNHPVSLIITKELNKFRWWTPAITKGETEKRTSISIVFFIANNKISGKVDRVDLDAFEKSFDRPQDPEIFNESYTYKNDSLNSYKFTVWNSDNSSLPNSWNDNISIDTNGLIWLTVRRGLVTFDGQDFKEAGHIISEQGKKLRYNEIATDNSNNVWVYSGKNIYMFDRTTWVKYDSSEIGIDGAYRIINNPASGEVFFCSDEGLTIYQNGKWTNINKSKLVDLPSNRVAFAKRDSKNRLWIGTYSGSVMIDTNDRITNFETSSTVLNGKCITGMDEDDNGNLYLTLYEFDRKTKTSANNDEGIAIRYANGTFKQFTIANSGMPFNHATSILYDNNEKVVWIGTDRAGLVRFDLNGNWENYHNLNSDIPTSYISSMEFDSNGNLYLATRQGLVKIEKK